MAHLLGPRALAQPLTERAWRVQQATDFSAANEAIIIRSAESALGKQARGTLDARPGAGGDRSLFLRLPWTELSGRQLGSGWDPMSELPVRQTW